MIPDKDPVFCETVHCDQYGIITLYGGEGGNEIHTGRSGPSPKIRDLYPDAKDSDVRRSGGAHNQTHSLPVWTPQECGNG